MGEFFIVKAWLKAPLPLCQVTNSDALTGSRNFNTSPGDENLRLIQSGITELSAAPKR
jgi:hypothetical protein